MPPPRAAGPAADMTTPAVGSGAYRITPSGAAQATRPTTRLPRRARPLCMCCRGAVRVFFAVGAAGVVRLRGERAVGWLRAWEWLVRRAGVAGCEPAALET